MKKSNNNVIRRFVSVFLVVLMVFSMIPYTAFAGTLADIVLPDETTTQAPQPVEPSTQVTPPEVTTSAPVEVTTQAPEEESSNAPIEAPTDAPSSEPSSGPIEAPADPPAEESTGAATEEPTSETTEEGTTEVPAEDVTIQEGFYRLLVDLNVSAVVRMNDSICTYVDVEAGNTVTVEITPPTGHVIKSITLDMGGEMEDLTPRNTAELDDQFKTTVTVTANAKINVTFAKKQYKITINAADFGEVQYKEENTWTTFDGKVITVEYCDQPEFRLVADDKYFASSLVFDGVTKNVFTSSSFHETQDDGLIFTADAVKHDCSLSVTFAPVEVVTVENALDNGYFKINLAPNAEPVKVLEDPTGKQTIVLPADGTATIVPAGDFADGFISLQKNGTFTDSVLASGDVSTIIVKKTALNNNIRYVELDVDFAIVNDGEVGAATIRFPDEEVGVDASEVYYSATDVNDIEISVPADKFAGLKKVVYKLEFRTATSVVTMRDLILFADVKPDETPEGAPSLGTSSYTLKYNAATGCYEGKIDIEASLVNQRDDVVVVVEAEDHAGNRAKVERKLVVNTYAPQVEITIDGSVDKNASLSDHYKGAQRGDVVRTATITIRDWAGTFDVDAAKACLKVTAYNNSTDKTELPPSEELFTVSEWNPDSNVHTCTINFVGDAYYHWEFGQYVNKVGTSDDAVEETAADGVAANIHDFTCDTSAPTAKLSIGTALERLENLIIGKFSDTELTVYVEDVEEVMSLDATTATFYKHDISTGANPYLTTAELEKLAFDEECVVPAVDAMYVIYARIVDGAGNVTYISSNGLIIDTTAGGMIAVIDEPAKIIGSDKYYSSDVVNIKVLEVYDNAIYRESAVEAKAKLGIYSGIASVDYTIEVLEQNGETNPDVETVSGNLWTFNKTLPVAYEELVKELVNGENGFNGNIAVPAAQFNYSNVRVTITATDNAGNPFAQQQFQFHINNRPPKVSIEIKDVPEGTDRFYTQDPVTAIVRIEDADYTFNPENIGFTVTGFDAEHTEIAQEVIDKAYNVDGWELDEDHPGTFKAIVTFDGDVNYNEWTVSYENNAGMEASATAPNIYTVDKTDPTAGITIKEAFWEGVLEDITFGIYQSSAYNVKVEANDLTSPLAKVEYYKTNSDKYIAPGEFDESFVWNSLEFEGNKCDQTIVVNEEESDEQFVIYVRVTDLAGNEIIINSNGAVLDKRAPVIELRTKAPAAELNGIYTSDITIDFAVDDGFDEDGTETLNYSGIKTVSYWVGYENASGKIVTTAKAKLYPQDDDVIEEGKRTETVSDNFVVKAADNNRSNVIVCVVAEDNAGNVSNTQTIYFDDSEISKDLLDFDITPPIVSVAYAEAKSSPYAGKYTIAEKYFASERIATFTVKERPDHFIYAERPINIYLNPTETTDPNGIIITAKDLEGKDVNAQIVYDAANGKYVIAEGTGENNVAIDNKAWNTNENQDDLNESTHALQVEFKADANYSVEVNYTDKANHNTDTLKKTPKKDGEDASPVDKAFVVDKTAPVGSITAIATSDDDGKTMESNQVSNTLHTSFTYSIYANQGFTFAQDASDVTAGIAEVYYYADKIVGKIVDENKELTSLAVEKLAELESAKWTQLNMGTIGFEETTKSSIDPLTLADGSVMASIYLKIIDMAGNVTYINTNGLILEENVPILETNAPIIQVNVDSYVAGTAPESGIYTDDITVKVSVQEVIDEGAYSGINKIYYEVYDRGERTQNGTLYDRADDENFKNNPNPQYNELLTKLDTVEEWKSGGGNPYIIVEAWEDSNKTNPRNNSDDVVLKVYAQDNSLNTSVVTQTFHIDTTPPTVDIQFTPETSSNNSEYFNENRTATITVTERNFDATLAASLFELSVTNSDGSVPTLSGWTEISEGTGNRDNRQHTATIEFTADGDYTMQVTKLNDEAGNACQNIPAQASFTIDQTIPTVSVSYDNNSAQNEKYFNASRTATITVNEHNFDQSNATATITASLSGSSVTAPSVSWSSSGDTHTGTVNYSSDADYTFDIKVTDLAGNQDNGADYGSSVAAKEFTVDTTIDNIIITGVENGVSYKDVAIPEVSFSDINYASHSLTLHRTRKDEINVDVKDIYLADLVENGSGFSGVFDTFDVKDQGNDGLYTFYVEASDLAGNSITQSVSFTLNRFGSVYTLSDYLVSLKGQYVQQVTENLVITEYNPDKLIEGSLAVVISRDGTPMDDVVCEVEPVINELATVGESGWYQYDYIINTSNFASDGIYKITVSSEDAAGNKPETTNYDECQINFSVDTTAPEITSIFGLEESIVDAIEQNVEFEIFDAIGLKSVTLYVNNQPIQVFDTFEDLIRFVGSHVFAEGRNQKVRFVAEDLAGNIVDTDAQDENGDYIFDPAYDFVRDLTVSDKWYVRWYANRYVFWGSIAGIGVFVLGFAMLIAYLTRRKKEKEKAMKRAQK